MKRLKSTLKFLAILLGCGLAGFILGAAIGSRPGHPELVRWERLADPPEALARLVEIDTQTRSREVVAETFAGAQVACCRGWPPGWHGVDYPRTRYAPGCDRSQSSLYGELPAPPRDCLYISQWEWTDERTFAALLEDGSVWRWHYLHGMDSLLNSIAWFTLAGLAAGAALAALTTRRP